MPKTKLWLILLSVATAALANNDDGSLSDTPQPLHQQSQQPRSSWTPEGYPSTSADPVCRGGPSGRVCDPDAWLSQADHDALDEALQDAPTHRTVLLPASCGETIDSTNEKDDVDDKGQITEVQYAVALVNQMDLYSPNSSLRPYSTDPEHAAEIFARHVHDTWGVGIDTAHCGGTGVVLFLSRHDRRLFISKGTALDGVLTDRRIDQVIEKSIKPLLQQTEEQCGAALLLAIQQLDAYLMEGPPDWKERCVDWIVTYTGYLAILGFFGVVGGVGLMDRKKRREYAAVESQLNELDRARAEAMQGRFQAKSCPICLEPFPGCEEAEENRIGGDGKATTNTTATTSTSTNATNNPTTEPRLGSDGRPLKLLRCGHVFDETCFTEWVQSGHHGKIDKCPICNQDVGQPTDAPQTAPTIRTARRGRNDRARTINDPLSTTTTTTSERDALLRDERAYDDDEYYRDERRAMEQYTRDRNFRLSRLASRFPRYVRPQEIERWSRSDYDGSLARDPTFVERDPVRESASSSSNNFRTDGGGSPHFGGGASGGGRGGSW